MAALSPTQQFVPPSRHAAPRRAPSTADVIARFMIFLAVGLMVGASLGYALFPIQWRALLPKDTTQERQFVVAVADKYWRDLDAVQAQNQLRTIDPDELTQLMATILHETKASDTRMHITALAQALDLRLDTSPLADLFGHPLVLLALFASLLPVAAGTWLVILPAMRERKLEELRREQERLAALDPSARVVDDSFAGLDEEIPPLGREGVPNETAAPNAGEKANTPTELPPLQAAPSPEQTAEEAAEHAEEEKNILQDIANLFETDDTSMSALETLAKNLLDLDVDEMLGRVQDIVNRLKNGLRIIP